MSELKPCPWCGEMPEYVDATRILGVHRIFHRCKVVGNLGFEYYDKDYGFERWNTRVTEVRE